MVAADPALLQMTAASLGLPLQVELYEPSLPRRPQRAGQLRVLAVPLAQPVVPGRLDVRNAPSVIAMLDRACDGCTNGEFAAMVTAPVHKGVLIEAGLAFSGHTEYLAARTRAALPVMMLLARTLRVALATTHLPLADVTRASRHRLAATLRSCTPTSVPFRIDARASPCSDSTPTPAKAAISATRRSR